MIMVEHFSRLGERYNELRKIYALWWEACRKDFKSDRSAEKAFDLTVEGLEMAEVGLKMKVKISKMSAIKSYLKVLSDEQHNLS
jgi:hypothetical protein